MTEAELDVPPKLGQLAVTSDAGQRFSFSPLGHSRFADWETFTSVLGPGNRA